MGLKDVIKTLPEISPEALQPSLGQTSKSRISTRGQRRTHSVELHYLSEEKHLQMV